MNDTPEELPERSNGYRVVAKCTVCKGLLMLGEDYRGRPYLEHISNRERVCPLTFYATADRPVVELGLFP